jgi:hypothetical protein
LVFDSLKPRRFNESQKATKSRQKLDSKSEDSLFRVLTNFGMFNFTNESEHLLSIATKDKATDVIKESPLNARKIGQKQLEDFVKDQLVLKDEEQSPKISLQTPISKKCSDSFVKLNIPKFVRTLKSESSDFESSFCLLFVAFCDSLNLLGLHETYM